MESKEYSPEKYFMIQKSDQQVNPLPNKDSWKWIFSKSLLGNYGVPVQPMTHTRGHDAPGIKKKAISGWLIPTIYVDCESERWQQRTG
jgi:hypothetical protein